MKKFILIILALVVFAMPVFSEKLMSRRDVLKYAFENSDGLARIQAEREKVVEMRREYYGKAFPDINAAFNYVFAPDLNGDSPSFVDGIAPFLRTGATEDEPTPADWFINDMALAKAIDGALGGMASMMSAKNTLMWEISATQPIFAQGKVRTGLRIADIALETVDEQYREAQFNLAQQIINAYNAALMAQQNLIIQQDALVIAEESHRLALARFNSGRGTVLDTLNTRFAVQQAVLRLREAEKGHRLSIKSLANAAALPNDNFTLSDTLVIPHFNLSEEAAWEEMQRNNASLRLLNKAKKLQSEQTTLARTDYRPIVAAFANIGQVNLFNNSDEFSGSDSWRWRSQIGLGVQMPIWNGGQRRSRMNQMRIEELKLEKQESEATSGLRLALAAAYEDLAVAREELSQTEQMLVLAEQGFRISQLAFELGQLTQLELNNNEQNFRMAKLAQNSAVFKINTAVVNIARLIGNDNLIALGN